MWVGGTSRWGGPRTRAPGPPRDPVQGLLWPVSGTPGREEPGLASRAALAMVSGVGVQRGLTPRLFLRLEDCRGASRRGTLRFLCGWVKEPRCDRSRRYRDKAASDSRLLTAC